MSILRALVLGVLAAFATILIAFYGDRLPEEVLLALLGLPVAVLVIVGVLGEGVTGAGWRLARSIVGTVLAAITGFAVVRYLSDFDWFRVTEPEVLLVLAGLAGACGGISAAAAPARGFAAGLGYTLGFVALLLIPLLHGDGAAGFVVGVALTLGSGTLVGTTLATVAR